MRAPLVQARGTASAPSRARSAGPPSPAAVALAGAAVLAEIAHPLLEGAALRAATLVAVLLLAAAAVVDASLRWGPRAGLLVLAAAGGLGLVAETVGVHTGVPFGTYAYAGSLGPQVLGVPLLVPLAWTMTAYPALFLGRRLAGAARGRAVRVALLGGGALASWDLFLDPQMVAAGHWTWAFPEPGLPGVPGVPLTNYAGWVLVSVPMVALLDRLLPASGPGDVPSPRAEAVPAAVLAWTWLGSCVGNLVFFDRPAVALWGGLAMGVFVAPYLVALRRAARRTGRRG